MHQSGQLKNAESVYRQVLAVDGSNANAWCFLAMSCHDQGRYEEAVTAYQSALQFRPKFPVALSNLGNTYKAMGRLDEAVGSCQAALRLKPDYHTAYNNLGVALVAQGKLVEAAECFENALKYAPQDAVAHANLSAALVRQGRLDEARHNSEQALRINPAYAEAHKNQAIVWLLQGDFERGWNEYEWRWKAPGSSMPVFPQPPWEGESLRGKSILLHAEQGLGDTIHFIRYAPLLQQQGARVIVQSQKGLIPLLRSCPGIDMLQEQGAIPPAYDVHAPLMSLPRIVGTRIDSIPANVPYLKAEPARIERWRAETARLQGFKVGLAWQGSPANQADRQRSIKLETFAPLAALPGVTLVSLQKGVGSEQVSQLRDRMQVIDYSDTLDVDGAFLDSAALMQNLDLVIAADTAVAHLAGALGIPVWIALNYAPDWRWLLQRSDSPWYPSARLFRQTKLGDWEPVFQLMATELGRRIGSPSVSDSAGTSTLTPSRITVVCEPLDLLDLIAARTRRGEAADPGLEKNWQNWLASNPQWRGLVDELQRVHLELHSIEQQLREGVRGTEDDAGVAELARRFCRLQQRIDELRHRRQPPTGP